MLHHLKVYDSRRFSSRKHLIKPLLPGRVSPSMHIDRVIFSQVERCWAAERCSCPDVGGSSPVWDHQDFSCPSVNVCVRPISGTKSVFLRGSFTVRSICSQYILHSSKYLQTPFLCDDIDLCSVTDSNTHSFLQWEQNLQQLVDRTKPNSCMMWVRLDYIHLLEKVNWT